MGSGPETAVLKMIVVALEERGAVVVKQHGSRYSTIGVPDLLGVLPGGRAFAVEVKKPGGGVVSAKQRFECWRWAVAGAVVVVGASSVDEVLVACFGDG